MAAPLLESLPPALAVGLMNPALAGALALTAVPILIHLLSRQRFRRIPWGAMRFLRDAERENRRRVRFEQWLLVLLRCLAMALLALLIARPFVRPELLAALLGDGGRIHRVLVLDDSASLGFRDGPAQEIDRLKRSASRLLEWMQQAAPGDLLTVYVTSAPDEPLIAGEPLRETALRDVLDRLGRVAPGSTPARPRGLIERIAAALREDTTTQAAQVYLFSDFQRSDWLGFDAESGSIFAPLAELEEKSPRLFLVASGVTQRDNVALASVSLERPQSIAGLPALVDVTVRNGTRSALRELRVQAQVDAAPLAPATLETVDPGGSGRTMLEVTFPDEGFAELNVSLSSQDGFAADDVLRQAVHVKPALAVLLVNGQPDADPQRDEVHLLRSALAPPGTFSSGIRVEVIDPVELESTPLDRFECVFLCNVPAPPPGAVDTLERYARAGGGIVFFLGDQVGELETWNRLLYADGRGLLPLPLADIWKRAAENEPVSLLRTEPHPVTALFPAGGEALSESVRFHGFVRTAEPAAARPPQSEPPPADGEEQREPPGAGPEPAVLAHYTDARRSPALVEKRFGRGRCLLFTSTVDLDWNDWARVLDGSYVVTMLELAHYAARRDEAAPAFEAGSPLTVSLSLDRYEPRAIFRSPAYPGEPPVEVQPTGPLPSVGEPVVLVGPTANRLGTYTVEVFSRSGGSEIRPLCVNLAAAESDLGVATRTELDAALEGLQYELLTADASFDRTVHPPRRELWRSIWLALVAALMLEQALAWWFGQPARSARSAAARSGSLGRITSWPIGHAPTGTR